MIASTVQQLCSQARNESIDALSLADLIHLTSTIMQELAICTSSQTFLTSELIAFLLEVTANDSLDLASLPMDMWLRLSVVLSAPPSF